MKYDARRLLAWWPVAIGLVIVAVAAYWLGVHSGDSPKGLRRRAGTAVLQAEWSSSGTSQKPSSANLNFGSFTLQGTLEAAKQNGIVLRTAGGNSVIILIDQHSVVMNPTGRQASASQLRDGMIVSVVARVNMAGQFTTLRIVQQ